MKNKESHQWPDMTLKWEHKSLFLCTYIHISVFTSPCVKIHIHICVCTLKVIYNFIDIWCTYNSHDTCIYLNILPSTHRQFYNLHMCIFYWRNIQIYNVFMHIHVIYKCKFMFVCVHSSIYKCYISA